MKTPWKTCDFCGGLEGAVIKREQGIWSNETFDKWISEHCECCPFFASGEACVYGEIEIS